MLKKSKDFWKKKAQDEMLLAENEKDKEKALEVHQLGWDRRVKESQWLLKGVNKIDDSMMNTLVAKTTKAKAVNKFSVVDINLVNDKNTKTQAKPVKKLTGVMGFFQRMTTTQTNANKGGKGAARDEPSPQKPERRRDAKQVLKEQIADKLREREERKNRRQFLLDTADRIKVLQKIGVLFKKPRMPTHHRDATEITGYERTEEEQKTGESLFVDALLSCQ